MSSRANARDLHFNPSLELQVQISRAEKAGPRNDTFNIVYGNQRNALATANVLIAVGPSQIAEPMTNWICQFAMACVTFLGTRTIRACAIQIDCLFRAVLL